MAVVFRTLRSQYLAVSLVTFVAMLGLLMWNAQRLMEHALQEHLDEEVEAFSPLLQAAVAPLLVERDYATLAELLEQNTRSTSLGFVEVTDRRGQRVGRAGDPASAALRVAELPLTVAGQAVGRLRFGVRTDLLEGTRHRLQRDSLLIGGAVTLAGALLLAAGMTWLSAGFARLSQASRRMAEGDTAVRLPGSRVRELDEVAGAFNRMAQAVQSQLDALRDQEQSLRGVLDTLSEGFMIVDRNDVVLEINEPFLRITGLPHSDGPVQYDSQMTGLRLLRPDGSPSEPHERPTRRAISSGEVQRDQVWQLQRPDGSRAWVSVNATPLRRAGSDAPWAALAAVADITRHVTDELALRSVNERLEQRVQERTAELERARDEAESASRAKSEFLSRMSHELRTPLNAILGFAQLLAMEHERLPDGDLQRVRQIEAAGWHLLALINDVLDLARIEAGAMTSSAEPVNLVALAADAAELVQGAAAQRAITLELPPADIGGAWVQADRVRLKQVLVNLLGNAVKYNRRGGRVTVAIDRETDGRRTVSVADTGRGFEPEQLARLYQPFTRFERAGEATEGTGIGLVITLRLVELMGGRLTVSSTSGVGSRFAVDLPAALPATALPDGAATALGGVTPERTPHRILVVEDNASNVELLRQVLARRENCQLEVATDGLAGLARAQQGGFDLAIVDIDLPGIDGIELARRLKADPATQRLPLLALSANAMPADMRRALNAGFERYLSKPLDVQRIDGEIDQLLARGGPR